MAQSHFLAASKTLILALLLGLLLWLAGPQQLRSLPVANLTQHTCSISQYSGLDTFRVYLPSDWHARQLADSLCQEGALPANYNQVTIDWQPREQITTESLLHQPYQLIWSRPHVIQGLLPDYQQHYQALSEMADYKVYWFSHQPQINLSPARLAQLRIGLLADSRSYSGYLVAMTQLSQLPISLEELEIHYYPSRIALIKSFLAQKVDLIPGIDAYTQLVSWPPQQKELITAEAPMGVWYLHHTLSGSVKSTLEQFLQTYSRKLQRKLSDPRESL